MIRPDQIPPEAVKAAWQAMMAPDALAMKRALAAAINAWPASVVMADDGYVSLRRDDIVLMLER